MSKGIHVDLTGSDPAVRTVTIKTLEFSEFNQGIIDRFFNKVNKTEGCWIWMAYRSPLGYGVFNVRSKLHSAHRVSWVISNQQPLDSRDYILHKCDNPKCVNPDHLFKGNQFDNMRDCRSKGRLILPLCRRMSEPLAKNVMALSKAGISYQHIEKWFSIPRTTVKQIIDGSTWKHIKGEYPRRNENLLPLTKKAFRRAINAH
jgi:hypothetical protein